MPGRASPKLNFRLLALLALFITAALAQQLTLPVMEGGDEVLHSNYAQYLLAHDTLPPRSDVTPGLLQGSGQPPLYYWAGAQVLRLLGIPPSDPAAVFDSVMATRNRWYAPPDQWNPTDNRNVFLHGAATQRFDMPDAETAVRVLRLVSLAFGVVAVLGAYGAMRELFASPGWALVGTAVFALTPQMVHMSAIVHNDIGAAAFPALILWLSLRLLRKGLSVRRALIIGLLLGLAGLTKINALLVAPAAVAAILIAWRRERRSFSYLIGMGIVVALPFALLFGSWAAWGWITWNDPLGTATHLRPGYFYDPPLTLAQILPLLPDMVLGYWGKLGAAIYLHPLTYTLFGGLVVLAVLAGLKGRSVLRPYKYQGRLMGLPLQNRRIWPGRLPGWMAGLKGQRLAREQALILLIAVIVTALGVLHWLQTIQFITGRLLYPAHIALAAAITGGLMRLPRRFAQTAALGTMAFASLVLAPLSIVIAFQPPPLLESPPPLQGSAVDYAHTIRLLGYQQESPTLNGTLHTITLCWQVLKPTGQPLAYSVKFVHDGVIVGDRTTVFGLGRFPSDRWQAGDTFCDAVDVPIIGELQSGQVYDMVVVVVDAITGASDIPASTTDGSAVTIPLIGQVVSPAGDQRSQFPAAAAHTSIVVPGFAALEAIDIQGELSAGQTVALNLLWHVTGRTDQDWSEFVHLIGQGTGVVVSDGKPRDGNYPTWAWSAGEYVAETRAITLPEDLAPGTYQLMIGFYRPDSGERVTIFEGEQPAADNSAVLLTFEIK